MQGRSVLCEKVCTGLNNHGCVCLHHFRWAKKWNNSVIISDSGIGFEHYRPPNRGPSMWAKNYTARRMRVQNRKLKIKLKIVGVSKFIFFLVGGWGALWYHVVSVSHWVWEKGWQIIPLNHACKQSAVAGRLKTAANEGNNGCAHSLKSKSPWTMCVTTWVNGNSCYMTVWHDLSTALLWAMGSICPPFWGLLHLFAHFACPRNLKISDKADTEIYKLEDINIFKI